MKVLFLVPEQYGLFDPLKEAFLYLGIEVYPFSYQNFIKKWMLRVNDQIFRLPDKFRLKWEGYFLEKINQEYIEIYDQIDPDLIFVYNNELLLPKTVNYFKKSSKIAFFLGDNPFYTPTNRYFLDLLFKADAVFSPDRFWISQLSKLGLDNMHYLLPGIPARRYYQKELSPEVTRALHSEVLYIGTCYPSTWGYKKARFLSHFTDFDLRIYGNRHWRRWFSFFPELEAHFQLRSGYLPTEKMNELYNSTKIIPIDGNPGVLTGVHFRIMEALGAGALPLLEWQDDLARIFPERDYLPAVKSYNDIKKLVKYYLDNESKRLEMVSWMRTIVEGKFSAEKNGELIGTVLGIKAKKALKVS